MNTEQRALAVLRSLEQGARLEPRPDGSYLLADARTRRQIDSATVALMQTHGWLEEREGVLVASQSGRARLRAEEDGFAAQHRVLETRLTKDERGRDCYVVVNAAESPLALLRRRGLIDRLQFEAGDKLRGDFILAQLAPRLGVDYSAPVGRRSGKPDIVITETALAAKQRFNAAMRAAGPGLSDVLFDVCCMLKGIEDSERERNWPRSSATVVLRLALARLVEHYRMDVRAGRSPVRSWSKD